MAWVTVGDRAPVALWCVPLGSSLYIVSGPGEQSAPGLAEARTAQVALRGDHGGRIVTWAATVSRIDPASDDWPALAPLVAAKRLNAPGSPAEVAQRWAASCALTRLTPAGRDTA